MKVTRSGLLGLHSTVTASAGAPKISGSIKERHSDNSLLCSWIVHLWTHMDVEFTQYVCCTPGEDTVAILDSILLFSSSNLSLLFFIS